MIIFAHPQFLLLLLLIPFFFIGLAVWMGARRRCLRKLGDEDLVNELMPSWSRSKRWVRAVIYSLAFLFFVIGLSRPQIGAKLKEYKARGAEIMIALDVSNSMLAQDYSPNRLERAKMLCQCKDVPEQYLHSISAYPGNSDRRCNQHGGQELQFSE